MQAGFAQADITPPVGTAIIGWLVKKVSDKLLDPLFARVAVFESKGERVAFIGLDTLAVRWTTTNEIRSRISLKYGFPGEAVMISATHSHAGPAVANVGEVPRDEKYIENMIRKILSAFERALENLRPAEIGFASILEWDLTHNRRMIMRDGTVRTHASFHDPDSLYIEGPIDPEVAVIVARREDGEGAGYLVNFSCHPTHHGSDGTLSAGYPGALARCMAERGFPVTVFLNGALGNTTFSRGFAGKEGLSMQDFGKRLAEDVGRALEKMHFRRDVTLGCARKTIELPYRTVTEDEIRGTVRGAQRFAKPPLYDKGMPKLVERIRSRKSQPAEVQVLFMDEYAFAGVPAEYFVEHGLRIKEASFPLHALVVGHANGMIGYVPTEKAFERGGYETTFAAHSRMAPEAGRMLADCAIELIAREKESRARFIPERRET